MEETLNNVRDKRFSTRKVNGKEKRDPIHYAQENMTRGTFANKHRTEFFDEAMGDIMADLFFQWLQTQAHEVKTREYLYNTAMALGSLKEKLVKYETYGNNLPLMEDDDDGQ